MGALRHDILRISGLYLDQGFNTRTLPIPRPGSQLDQWIDHEIEKLSNYRIKPRILCRVQCMCQAYTLGLRIASETVQATRAL